VLLASVFDELNPHVGWGLLWFGVVSGAMETRSWISRRLSNFRIVWLGERSYSLYLVHFTVIGLACHAVSLMTDSKGTFFILLTRTISIVASLAVTIVVFHFIERRFARNLVTADVILPWRHHAEAAQTYSQGSVIAHPDAETPIVCLESPRPRKRSRSPDSG
jgi:peptidoglycan/LPS O-acetylase OafA/YrhL